MLKIEVNHYTDTLMYAVDRAISEVKSTLNQFILSLKIGLTAEQFAVLDTIYLNKNICQQDLAKVLRKDKSNIKRIAQILENKGMILITSKKKGGKVIKLFEITEEGKSLINQNIEIIKAYMECLFKNVSEEEAQIIRNVTNKLSGIKRCF